MDPPAGAPSAAPSPGPAALGGWYNEQLRPRGMNFLCIVGFFIVNNFPLMLASNVIKYVVAKFHIKLSGTRAVTDY